MNKLFSPDSPVMKLLSQFTTLIFLNLLWLLGCLPIITIGTSTAALYQCLISFRKENSISIWKDFWHAFQNNFKQATILFLVLSVIVALTVLDIFVVVVLLQDLKLFLKIIMILPFLLVVPALGYVFPLQAQFENTIINTLKNAWIMSVTHYFVSILVLFTNSLPLIILLVAPNLFISCTPILICLGGSLIGYVNTALLSAVFTQYMPAHNEE